MTTQEIHTLLNIPTSTLSDWDRSTKRNKLAKLLRAINTEEVVTLLNKKSTRPKFSEKTQKIKLNKKLFSKDLLWLKEDGEEIFIKELISIYLNIPNQEDTSKLIELFGEKRVKNVLNKTQDLMNSNDYQETYEQIEYVLNPLEYRKKYALPIIEVVLHNPKQRYIDLLQEEYSDEEILNLAKVNNVNLSSSLQIKKMLKM
ncbi:hypothetical protein JHD48_07925 [Sulfurimonas sp. SAG-AH-194-I05]|nr:hypothetical protein [Sulfurimonas sp. SAG-AH-194-I05]MDF1875659.1 hypothetical protein [Sulfurimonas sp. SAG-AH-194-I05]